MKKLTVTADALNLRSKPSLQGEVIDVLNKGDVVEWMESSGDDYWRKIKFGANTGWASHKYLTPESVDLPDEIRSEPPSPFPWFAIALGEIGVKEVSGNGDNPRIVEYHRSTTLPAPDRSNDETAWCSSFANWCVEKSGHAGTDSAWARSWLNWGRSTATPVVGCIVVFRRNVNFGHVGFFISKTESTIKILDGNMSDSVRIDDYPVRDFLGYRVPR